MQPTKFTIVLPCKSGLKYLEQSVRSVLNQDWPHFELKILIHQSDKEVYNFLDSIKDNRVEVMNDDNVEGINANWQRINTIPKAEYFTILGYDDVLYSGYLSCMNRLIHAHPDAGLFQAHFKYIDAHGNFIRSCKPMEEKINAAEFIRLQATNQMDSMATGYMIRTADFNQSIKIKNEYPNVIFADYALWVDLIKNAYLAVSPEVQFDYRLHSNVSLTTSAENYRKAFEIYLQYLATIEAKELKQAIASHGGALIKYYGQSLSHRLLKTPSKYQRISVKEFVSNLEKLSKQLNITNYSPANDLGIKLSVLIDENPLLLRLFKRLKGISDE